MESSSPDYYLITRELLELIADRLPPRMVVILLLMDVLDFNSKRNGGIDCVKGSSCTSDIWASKNTSKAAK